MPELPEVETIARKLAPVLTGQTIARVDVLWARTVDRPTPDAFCAALTGARVLAIDRRGKYIQMALSTGQTLLVHLRMSGKFAVYSDGPGEDTHARLRMQLADGTWVVYIDPRKFGRNGDIDLTTIAEVIVTLQETGAAYPFRFAGITALCTALASAASYPLTGSGIWGLAAGVGVFLVVFAAAFALSKPLEAGDCAALGRLSPRLAAWAQRFARS